MAQASVTLQRGAAALERTQKPRTVWSEAWRRFRHNTLAIFGALVIALFAVVVAAGPILYAKDPAATNFAVASQLPSADHPLGTDDLGRDMLARMLFGGRISIAVGITAMLISIVLGTLIGAAAGFFGGWLDTLLMRVTDMFLSLPTLAVVLLIGSLYREPVKAALGANLGIFTLVVAIIGVLNWMATARLVRGAFLALKEREFVEASRALGVKSRDIITRHILPNSIGPIAVSATLNVGAAIITESTLSFLGEGLPSDVPTWGRLLFENKEFIQLTPHLVIWPCLAIFLTVLSVNFVGDGLRDALDPRGK
jgi:peptide/nickel transport system permease protein